MQPACTDPTLNATLGGTVRCASLSDRPEETTTWELCAAGNASRLHAPSCQGPGPAPQPPFGYGARTGSSGLLLDAQRLLVAHLLFNLPPLLLDGLLLGSIRLGKGERLFQLFATRMGDDRKFGPEPGNVLRLLLDHFFRHLAR